MLFFCFCNPNFPTTLKSCNQGILLLVYVHYFWVTYVTQSNHSPHFLEEAQWRHNQIRGNATKLSCCLFVLLLKIVYDLFSLLRWRHLSRTWLPCRWSVCHSGCHAGTAFNVDILGLIYLFSFNSLSPGMDVTWEKCSTLWLVRQKVKLSYFVYFHTQNPHGKGCKMFA